MPSSPRSAPSWSGARSRECDRRAQDWGARAWYLPRASRIFERLLIANAPHPSPRRLARAQSRSAPERLHPPSRHPGTTVARANDTSGCEIFAPSPWRRALSAADLASTAGLGPARRLAASLNYYRASALTKHRARVARSEPSGMTTHEDARRLGMSDVALLLRSLVGSRRARPRPGWGVFRGPHWVVQEFPTRERTSVSSWPLAPALRSSSPARRARALVGASRGERLARGSPSASPPSPTQGRPPVTTSMRRAARESHRASLRMLPPPSPHPRAHPEAIAAWHGDEYG